MNLPTEALRDLQRCGFALFRYTVALLLVLSSYRCILFLIEMWLPQETYTNAIATAQLFAVLLFAAVISMAQSVYFSLLGAAIDRPLWKYKGAKDALRRFFVLWFILNLLLVTLLDIQARLMSANLKDLAAFLEFVILAVHVTALPLGACLMHWGSLQWNEVGEALRPLFRLFSLTLFPIVIGFIQFTLASARVFALTENTLVNLIFFTITDIPLVMIDAYIFALIWRICMHHRSLPPDTENPFDF